MTLNEINKRIIDGEYILTEVVRNGHKPFFGDEYEKIRTEVGVDKNISFQLDQDFEFLEILSLQILQNEVYPRDCADYGVVVGRVVANGGLGVPNAKVSIFVPINEVDSLNDRILQIYQ